MQSFPLFYISLELLPECCLIIVHCGVCVSLHGMSIVVVSMYINNKFIVTVLSIGITLAVS